MLLAVAHEHDLRAHSVGSVEQLSRLAARQKASLVHDPELWVWIPREGISLWAAATVRASIPALLSTAAAVVVAANPRTLQPARSACSRT